MKKGWYRYLIAELVVILLVVCFFWVSHFIQTRKVYRFSVATLLSSYKKDQNTFKRKYNQHIVYLTGKVYNLWKQDPENYVLAPGEEYIGSYLVLIEPDFKAVYDVGENEYNSIRCAIDNKYLSQFEKGDVSTIKGTIYANYDEVVLKDCTKVEDKKKTEEK